VTVGTGGVQQSPQPSGIADVLDVVLDKGIVIDAYVRVSLVGIELLTIEARIVVASIDTYLRYAEEVRRLGLQSGDQQGLPGLFGEMQQSGAERKTKGALDGVKESAKEVLGSVVDDEEDAGRPERRPASRSASGQASRRSSTRRPRRGPDRATGE
jgi:gas vesicle structural protein